MNINELSNRAFENALAHGFHKNNQNTGEMLMLIVSELAEALEADRTGNRCEKNIDIESLSNDQFKTLVKDTFEDELADAVIRVADLCGYLKIDLESHIKAKMRYNESRPYKHGKEY